MSRDVTSPFSPGRPVEADLFVGRVREIEHLLRKLRNAEAGRLEVGFLSGERAIGKTSLAAMVGLIAERNREMVTIHSLLSAASTLEEAVRQIFTQAAKHSVDKPWASKVLGFFGQHLKKVDLFGVTVEFQASPDDLRSLARDLPAAIRRLLGRLGPDRRGLFLILDDINGLAESAEFANWLKYLVDSVAISREPFPVYLLLVGLEERRRSLLALQPSLARVFDPIDIRAWSDEEAADFYARTFAKVKVEVEPEALSFMVRYTGGLPVFAHEIGDATLNHDVDGRIQASDAFQGLVDAAEIIGRKYLDAQVFQAIRSTVYRSILRKLSRSPFSTHFRRSEVVTQLTPDEAKTFDNFLARMRRLGVIVADEDGGPGAYRFAKDIYPVYLHVEAERNT